MNDLPALLPILILVLVFYFFIVRPQGKRRREFTDMQQRTTIGSRVMLTSGIYGTIVTLGDETMHVEIAPGVQIEAHRNVVAKILDGALSDDDADSGAGAVDDRRNDDESGKA